MPVFLIVWIIQSILACLISKRGKACANSTTNGIVAEAIDATSSDSLCTLLLIHTCFSIRHIVPCATAGALEGKAVALGGFRIFWQPRDDSRRICCPIQFESGFDVTHALRLYIIISTIAPLVFCCSRCIAYSVVLKLIGIWLPAAKG